MKQKKLVLKVNDSEGNQIHVSDPASLQHVQSALTLFDEVGTEFVLEIVEFEMDQSQVHN